MKALPEASRHN